MLNDKHFFNVKSLSSVFAQREAAVCLHAATVYDRQVVSCTADSCSGLLVVEKLSSPMCNTWN
jgi:hypothetical protein